MSFHKKIIEDSLCFNDVPEPKRFSSFNVDRWVFQVLCIENISMATNQVSGRPLERDVTTHIAFFKYFNCPMHNCIHKLSYLRCGCCIRSVCSDAITHPCPNAHGGLCTRLITEHLWPVLLFATDCILANPNQSDRHTLTSPRLIYLSSREISNVATRYEVSIINFVLSC